MKTERTDSFHRTISTGEDAFRKIKTYKTSASPRGYEVWFSYSAGYDVALKSAVDARLGNGGITDEELDAVYDEHLSPTKLSDQINRMGVQLADEAQQVLAMLQANLDHSESFSTVLSGAVNELEGAGSPGELAELVHKLVTATRTMEQSSRSLEARLADTSREVDDLRAQLAVAQAEAFTDALTSLMNRKALDAELKRQLAKTQNSQEPLSLLMIDIDHFKLFNDVHGHQTGDQVLRLVAQALKQGIRGADLGARYGGEEFAVILPNTTGLGAITVAEALRQSVMTKYLVKKSTKERVGKITVSIGIATYADGDTTHSLMERSDRALYLAKDRGRNRVCSQTDLEII